MGLLVIFIALIAFSTRPERQSPAESIAWAAVCIAITAGLVTWAVMR